jgi:hypothetical protein
VTDFTVVRSLLLLRVRAAEIGPSRHFAACSNSVAFGAKRTRHDLLLVRLRLRMTHSGVRRRKLPHCERSIRLPHPPSSDAVNVEPVGEFALKGIRRPLAAYNVLDQRLN